MKCPHCLVDFHDTPKCIPIANDAECGWGIVSRTCPNCKLLVVELAQGDVSGDGRFGQSSMYFLNPRNQVLVRPKSVSRVALPSEVPSDVSNDYREACLVLADSPKASAALSRRCLQHLLRKYAKIMAKSGNLADEIQAAIDSQTLPSHLSESLDAIRNIGNFAAHPMKSTSSGEIMDVEPGEAEWTLDVLEELFDFYFVQLAKLAAKRAALNGKLKEAGKPPMR